MTVDVRAVAAKSAVTFVDHTSAPGGAGLGMKRLLEAFGDRSRFRVIFFEGGPLAQAIEGLEVDTDVAAPRGRSGNRLARTLAALGMVWSVRSGVMVANSLPAAYAMALVPKRGVIRVCYVRQDVRRNVLSWPRWVLVNLLALPRSDALMVNSEWSASRLPWWVRAKPRVLAYPVSGVRRGAAPPAPRSDSSNPLRVISLSRLTPWKGVHVLLDAVRLAEQADAAVSFEVTIAGAPLFGEEDYEQELHQQASRLRSAVRFVGHVEDVGTLLRNQDVLTSNSLEAEPFGQIVPQAMAHGVVAVSTDHGGPVEVITQGISGVLVPPGNAEALASTLMALDRDREATARIARAGWEAVEPFCDPSTVRQFEAGLVEITEACRGGGRRPRSSLTPAAAALAAWLIARSCRQFLGRRGVG